MRIAGKLGANVEPEWIIEAYFFLSKVCWVCAIYIDSEHFF